MKFKISRYSLSLAVLLFYLVPVIFFSSYSIGLMSPNKSWGVLTLGLLLSIGGTCFLFILMKSWEDSFKKRRDVVPPAAGQSSTSFDIYPVYQDEVGRKEELLEVQQENDSLQKQLLKSTQDLSEYKIFAEEQLNHKSLLIQSLQQRFGEQQEELETKQEKIFQFESKIRDLSYEIKTLLQLNESEVKEAEKAKKKIVPVEQEPKESLMIGEESFETTEARIHTPSEATSLVKRCIDIAQKLAGANYYGNEGSRYRDMMQQGYALDLRRLFDSLRSENDSLILVYSQKEDRLLFVNNQSRAILGWSPEKLIQDFQSIVQKGMVEWKAALSWVATHYEAQTQLLMKTKMGNDLLVQCHLGMIPIGIFKGYVIGVMYLPVPKLV